MKNFALICLTFSSIAAFAQRTITKDVGDFYELKVYDLIEVNLIQSNENKVVIKGNHTDDVRIINQNGKLKLRMELDTRFQGEDTYIEVYFKNIKTIDANEGSYIAGNEMIEQEEIELKAQEGGRIKVGLTVENAKIKAVSGGIVTASGLATSQEIQLNTGGIFEGRELRTQDTKIGITAAGEAEVNASEKVEVRVTAGGDVTIYGNPREVVEKKIAGGRVKIMN
jgi:hypothetical protein